jgi:hypothetical protein
VLVDVRRPLSEPVAHRHLRNLEPLGQLHTNAFLDVRLPAGRGAGASRQFLANLRLAGDLMENLARLGHERPRRHQDHRREFLRVPLHVVPVRVGLDLSEIVRALDLIDKCAVQTHMGQFLRNGHAVSGEAIRSVVICKVLVDEDENLARAHVPQDHSHDLVVGSQLGPDVEDDALGLLDQQVHINRDQNVRPNMAGEIVRRKALQFGDGIDPYPISRHARSSLIQSRCPL